MPDKPANSSIRPDFVTDASFPKETPPKLVESPFLLDAKALPLDWLLNPSKNGTFIDRVLARLVQSEAHEPNLHYRDDYRQTFIALAKFSRGEFPTFWDALVDASYRMYGIHPEMVWPKILAHRRWLLGDSNVKRFPARSEKQSNTSEPKEKQA